MGIVRRISRSALVPHSADEMFRLVDDVEAYPEFLPWCDGATVDRRTGDTVEASLTLHLGAVRQTLTTRNRRVEGDRIDSALSDGPFRHLTGGWRFQDLGGDGSKASLELQFEFASRALDLLLGARFEEICNSLIDAFTQRALDVYGRR